ncbi:unnamed protein product [Rhizopus microsporus]|nr:auxin efflux carrier [Rhizopus microsporus]
MQVMTIVFIGAILAYYDYIDNDQQRWLSRLNMIFFTPCLLFTNIASVVSLEKLFDLWPIPAFYITFLFISWILCQLFMPLFKVETQHRRFVLACVLFSNTNSLPVAIMSGLAVSESGKSLYFYTDDTQATVSARGISYILFFGLFSNLLRWSYGFSLLRRTSKDEEETIDVHTSNTFIQSNQNSYGSISTTETSEKGTHRLIKKLMRTIQQSMSPPLLAAIFAFLVGICRPLKHLLYSKDSFLYGSFTYAIQSCGKTSVPIVLICLGAQLKMIRETQAAASHEIHKTVTATIFIRMFLTPLCAILSVFIFGRLGQPHLELASDPVFLVAIIIAGCTPTSINLAQITQANRVFQDEMLHVLFWSYGVACIPVCIVVVFAALFIVKHLAT